jgi:hypothetical protein
MGRKISLRYANLKTKCKRCGIFFFRIFHKLFLLLQLRKEILKLVNTKGAAGKSGHSRRAFSRRYFQLKKHPTFAAVLPKNPPSIERQPNADHVSPRRIF